ncbi:aldo/keto reductase family protein [Butyrivibrio sp. LC3010]|uniref:aldo/keto reductase family protein n=1 Tax=Butyrivibrio sp. LC3010 TaxID=1280680 RepID=UPI0009DC41B2|nr:aldo/keto reductase [Butyrivibrio sp. LC3010]
MDTVRLNNQIEMPIQGIGTKDLSDPDICEQVVLFSFMNGYRLIDTTPSYHNQASIGIVISELSIDRSELFITSRISPFYYKKNRTLRCIEKTLKNLRTDYLDLALLETPIIKGWQNAWQQLEKAVEKGLVKSIGVCNFMTEKSLDELCSIANIKPVVDQIQCHPFLQQRHIQKKLNEKNIQLEAWYPLGHGHSLLLNNSVLMDIATAHHTTVPQIILKWHQQMGHVYITKSSNPDHIQRNLHLDHLCLTPDDMKQIEALDVSRSFYQIPEFVQKLEYSLVH